MCCSHYEKYYTPLLDTMLTALSVRNGQPLKQISMMVKKTHYKKYSFIVIVTMWEYVLKESNSFGSKG